MNTYLFESKLDFVKYVHVKMTGALGSKPSETRLHNTLFFLFTCYNIECERENGMLRNDNYARYLFDANFEVCAHGVIETDVAEMLRTKDYNPMQNVNLLTPTVEESPNIIHVARTICMVDNIVNAFCNISESRLTDEIKKYDTWSKVYNATDNSIAHLDNDELITEALSKAQP